MRIAMVCLGNICRSPMAASVARSLLAEAGIAGRVDVVSFGTAGYHEGESAHSQADGALRRHGWPAGGHRARRLRRGDLDAADLVLCADKANLAEVRRLASSGSGGSESGDTGLGCEKFELLRSFDCRRVPGDDEVPDPWGGRDADFDHTLELIERACRGLVCALLEQELKR